MPIIVPHKSKPWAKRKNRFPLIQTLILAGLGLLCLMVVGGVLKFFGGSSTTAGDYTTAEVKEIIDILKRDDETRHGLLIPNSSMNDEQISLDLWEAVLGKPDAVVKSRGKGEDWTYKTKDGTVAVPILLWNEMGKPDIGMPWLFAADPQFSTGLGDKGADRESLKRHILAMKRRVDKTLPENPYEGMSPNEIRALVAKEAEERHRQERERLDQEEAERQVQRDEQFNEDAVIESIQRKADADFHDHVREYFRFGSPERTALSDQAAEWIERRREALTSAWKAGTDWRQVPLPNKDTVVAAIKDGKSIPVVGGETPQGKELGEQPDQAVAPGPQEKGTANDVTKNERSVWKASQGGIYSRQKDGTWLEQWKGSVWGPFTETDSTDDYIEITRSAGNVVVRLYDQHTEVCFRNRGDKFEKLYDGGWATELPQPEREHPNPPEAAPKSAPASQPNPLTAPFDEAQAHTSQKAWAEHLGVKVIETNAIGMKFVLIPPGQFAMGEKPDSVPVTLSRPYYLAETEVTQAQWKAIMGSTPWGGKDNVRNGPNFPANYVNWEDAISFCQMLTEQERKTGLLPDDWEYTLPTEAQWEYACRAGTTTIYSFGDDETTLGDYAWYNQNAWEMDEKYAHAVGTKKPNAFGLYDMHGNVWEWCRDWFHPELLGGINPEATEQTPQRVTRGGAWDGQVLFSRSGLRGARAPSFRHDFIGFRVARIRKVTETSKSPVPLPTAKPALRPPVRALSELSTSARELGLWVSPDGLRIYFEREGNPTRIFMAQRPDPDALFNEPRELTPGRHPTLSADETILIVIGSRSNGRGESLQVARRPNRNQPFPMPVEIPELVSVQTLKTPFLSADGLTLVFFQGGLGSSRQFVFATRANIEAKWSIPKPLRISDVAPEAQLSWPFLTKDGLTLIVADESESGAGRFYSWNRPHAQAPFTNRREIKIPGEVDIFGRSPFFVEATGELFFASTRPRRFARYLDQQKSGDWNLWVVEGWTFP